MGPNPQKLNLSRLGRRQLRIWLGVSRSCECGILYEKVRKNWMKEKNAKELMFIENWWMRDEDDE